MPTGSPPSRLASKPPLIVEGTLTLSTDGAEVRITGGPHGQLRIEIDDLATLKMLRDLSAALPGPDRGTGSGKRVLTRRATEALDTLGITVEIVVAGQRIAEAGRGIRPDTIAKLMGLGPVDVDKSAAMKLGRQLLSE